MSNEGTITNEGQVYEVCEGCRLNVEAVCTICNQPMVGEWIDPLNRYWYCATCEETGYGWWDRPSEEASDEQ